MDWDIEKRDSVSSTQDALRDVLSQHPEKPEGYGVQARTQSKGRGRHGRIWQSPEGNLYLSFLLRPFCRPEKIGQVSILTGLAVAQGIEKILGDGAGIRVKWPNDVLVEGRKISGILIEREGSALLVGIGINVANSSAENAVALDDLVATPVGVERAQACFTMAFDRLYEKWNVEGFADIRRMWLERSFPAGARIGVKTGDRVQEGAFHDIDMEGNLLMMSLDNTLVRISSGDVYFT